MRALDLKEAFEAGLDWEGYLATNPDKAQPWRQAYDAVQLSDSQRQLVTGFSRQVNALCVSGIWCGDCVRQGPLIQRIAEANPCITLRWIDRDDCLGLAEQIKVNAGLRVPMLIMMAQDFEPVSIFGDRPLTTYRAMAARQLTTACPLPGAAADADEQRGALQDWLDEFERVHLLLRLSGRLRELHGD
jgi:hypothetical protein